VEGRDLSSRQTQDVARDREIGQPINSEQRPEAADGVAHGCASEAPPDDRGGNRYAQPTVTAPHPDSTILTRSHPHGLRVRFWIGQATFAAVYMAVSKYLQLIAARRCE